MEQIDNDNDKLVSTYKYELYFWVGVATFYIASCTIAFIVSRI